MSANLGLRWWRNRRPHQPAG